MSGRPLEAPRNPCMAAPLLGTHTLVHLPPLDAPFPTSPAEEHRPHPHYSVPSPTCHCLAQPFGKFIIFFCTVKLRTAKCSRVCIAAVLLGAAEHSFAEAHRAQGPKKLEMEDLICSCLHSMRLVNSKNIRGPRTLQDSAEMQKDMKPSPLKNTRNFQKHSCAIRGH